MVSNPYCCTDHGWGGLGKSLPAAVDRIRSDSQLEMARKPHPFARSGIYARISRISNCQVLDLLSAFFLRQYFQSFFWVCGSSNENVLTLLFRPSVGLWDMFCKLRYSQYISHKLSLGYWVGTDQQARTYITPSDTSRDTIRALVTSTSSESAMMSPKLLILSDPRARAYALSNYDVSVCYRGPYVSQGSAQREGGQKVE